MPNPDKEQDVHGRSLDTRTHHCHKDTVWATETILTARDFHTRVESFQIKPKRCMDRSSQDSRYKIFPLATCTPSKVPAFQYRSDHEHRVRSIIDIPLKHQRPVTPKPVAQLLHSFPYAMLKVLRSS
jgi:hypothetical protein